MDKKNPSKLPYHQDAILEENTSVSGDSSDDDRSCISVPSAPKLKPMKSPKHNFGFKF